MKTFIQLTAIILLITGFSLSNRLFAQDEPDNSTDKINVKKELKTVLKDLPYESQVQVLKFAERRREAIRVMAERKEKAKTASDQKLAQPQPPKPKEIHVPSTVKVSPAPSGTAIPGRPTAPKRPAYMEEADALAPTMVEWTEDLFDFGEIKQGEKVKHTFTFKNTGENPLKITRVRPSCGCTSPNWTKEEIAPGSEGFIEVIFNSAGKSGVQSKSVTVTGNFKGTNKMLRFKGVIVKPESSN